MQPSLRNKSLILNRIAVILKNLKNNKNYVEKIERERERETERQRERAKLRDRQTDRVRQTDRGNFE